MKKLNQAILAVAATAVLSAPALAANKFNDHYTAPQQTSWANNFYVGGQGGWAHYASDDFPGIKRNSFTLGGFVGYNFNQYLAAELGYKYIDGPKAGNDEILGADVYSNLITFMGRFNIPLTQSISAFAKAGGAWMRTDADLNFLGITIANEHESRVRPIVAGGLEYRLNQSIGLNAQYTRVFGGGKLPSYDLVTGGITYYFA
ncbi:MAG: outer membrane beta-barrel protein [Pseudomonadota bacterium]